MNAAARELVVASSRVLRPFVLGIVYSQVAAAVPRLSHWSGALEACNLSVLAVVLRSARSTGRFRRLRHPQLTGGRGREGNQSQRVLEF